MSLFATCRHFARLSSSTTSFSSRQNLPLFSLLPFSHQSPTTTTIPIARPHRRFFNIFKYYEEHAKTPGQLRVKKDLEKGYFFDHNQITRDPRGKLFPSNGPNPIQPSKSKKFLEHPISLKTFSGTKVDDFQDWAVSSSSATLLLVSLRRPFSSDMISSWRNPIEKSFPSLAIKELVFVDGRGYRLSWFIWRRVFANGIPDLDNAAYHLGVPVDLFEQNLISNKFVGYAYLLDQLGKVRWRGCGMPDDSEIAHLSSTIKALDTELPFSPKNEKKKK